MKHKRGQLRIIGGRWKSRRIHFVEVEGLRPSTDMVRETLFNWLPHVLHGKSCLDLFAGSGALGFEAASRGAVKVVMVESHPQAINSLHANRDHLQMQDTVEIFPVTANRFMQRCHSGFDIIFVDPPFDLRMIEVTCENLQKHRLPNPSALVYIESKCADNPLPIPSDWHIIRDKAFGIVQSTLIQT